MGPTNQGNKQRDLQGLEDFILNKYEVMKRRFELLWTKFSGITIKEEKSVGKKRQI